MANKVLGSSAGLHARLSFCPSAIWLLVLAIILIAQVPMWAAGNPTITQLSVSPGNAVSPGTVMTLTATVTSSGSPLTSGLVKFCDVQTAIYCEDSALLGSVWLTRGGTATLKMALSYGPHNLHAVFQGTASYSGSSSTTQSLAIQGVSPSTTSIVFSQYLGYSGLNEAQTTVSGSPIPSISGTLSFLDASNANFSLTSALLGTPTIGFTALASVGGTLLQQPRYTVVGDFNGDGDLDFAVASSYANAVQIYLGHGD
jgi:hypothetical protein